MLSLFSVMNEQFTFYRTCLNKYTNLFT